MDLAQKPVYKLDLAAGTSVVNLTTPLVEGDDRAQTFTLELTDKGAPANLDGYSVTAYFGRGKTAEAEADTIPLSGTVSGNVATITLTESCYSRSCYFSMPIRLSNGATGQKRTYLIVRGTVVKSVDGEIIDPDGTVPSLDDLFAQIAVMERSRQAAEEATEEALAAAARADEAREGIQGDLDALTEDLVSISQAVNMFDKTTVVDGYVNYGSGAVNSLSGNKATDYIPVKPNSTIVLINFQTATSDSRGMAFYNSAKYYVGGIQYTSTGDIVFEVPNDVYYIRATIYASKVDYGCIVSKYDAKERTCPSYTDLLVKTLCIGDSLTVGSDYTSGEYGGNMKENYPYYLGKLTGNEVDYIATAGFSAKNWWDKNQNNDFSAYDSAIIWLGTNEGLLDAGYVDLSTNTGCYGAIIKKLRADNPNIKIFLCKVKHSSGNAATTNSVISNFVQAYNTGVIDIPSSDLWDAENMAIYHPNNNVHFSKVGNHALANFIKSEMDKYIASNLSSFNDLILGHGA